MPSQAQINHFLNHPEQFLRRHSLRWRGPAPDDQSVIDVAMVDRAGTARIRTGGRFLGMGNAKADAPMFELRRAGNGGSQVPPGTPTFQVQWSGYKAGQGRTARLPAAGGPGIMLTPEFTGCTAVCRANRDGSAEFSHYNLMNGTATLDDADMRAIAQAEYGGGQATMTKGDVRARGKGSGAVVATVVGVRRLGGWEFWVQIRETKSSGEQIRAVERL